MHNVNNCYILWNINLLIAGDRMSWEYMSTIDQQVTHQSFLDSSPIIWLHKNLLFLTLTICKINSERAVFPADDIRTAYMPELH